MRGQRLISFDLHADFAFFKKPDYNDGILLSYNMIHKPALLGLLGAVIGLQGYRKKRELPEYYQRLATLQVGIEPLSPYHDKGNFRKSVVKYTNTVGYANQDGNLLIEESLLIKPAYRCYLLLSEENEDHLKLYEYLRRGWAEYIPYLGKNEYPAWFGESFREYEFTEFHPLSNFRISSLFIKEDIVKEKTVNESFSMTSWEMENKGNFIYFERLPKSFDIQLMQYELAEFVFMDWWLDANIKISSLYQIAYKQEEKIIQFF
ncbi:type I-B CRISPR-associated protein Cas5b [Parabacteroides sp. AM08-6]|uniref:type I-B CRISPR-associated protein Cas5b n=1 Tax=Parabacteroides sp. AM08-6 TaxID=2292053 RepID=UPI000F00B3DE|nr:type I-B CRISPR-associated protein Cas5b [Parabacteroides sp. AM08-6]RHJ87621.1 type I-B CRISPR-associated protein Cas5 [Parabacteroides sp. AM08-6]